MSVAPEAVKQALSLAKALSEILPETDAEKALCERVIMYIKPIVEGEGVWGLEKYMSP